MRLIRLPELLHKVGLSRAQIYNMCHNNLFPKPISLGAKAVAWHEDEIDDWMMSKVRQRDARVGLWSIE
ncbi:AlpA family transcriptional regulator [Vibrio alginolyticus]